MAMRVYKDTLRKLPSQWAVALPEGAFRPKFPPLSRNPSEKKGQITITYTVIFFLGACGLWLY